MNTHRRTRMPAAARRVLSVGAVAAVTTAALSGCSMDWASMSPNLPGASTQKASAPSQAKAAPPKAVVTASQVAAREAQPDATAGNELETGSTTHKLNAGDRSVVIDYWTTQDSATWTAERGGVVQLAAHVEGSDARHEVKVSRFSAVLVADGARTSLADDRGDFVVTPPFSYGSAVTVPALPTSAQQASIAVQLDLLVETAPRSGSYFRQTVLDTLQLAFVPSSNEVSK